MGNQEIVIVTRGLYTVALLTVCIQFYLLQCLPSILAKLKKICLKMVTGVVGGGDVGGSSAHRPRTASMGSKTQQQQHYDDSGPVDITARVHQKVCVGDKLT